MTFDLKVRFLRAHGALINLLFVLVLERLLSLIIPSHYIEAKIGDDNS